MKFKIHVKNADSDWWESYDKNITDPQRWAAGTIKQYNTTLHEGDLPRELLEVVVEDTDNAKFHDWYKRTDGMSVDDGHGLTCDLYRCRRCGITGKRHGLGQDIQIDWKFRAKVFKNCDTAQAEMKKRGW